MTHHENAFNKLFAITSKRIYGMAEPVARPRMLRERFDQIAFDIQYQDERLGNKSELLVLFSDGTWRLVVS